MVSDLTLLIPSALGSRISDREGFIRGMMESCPTLSFFQAEDLPATLRRQKFWDGMLALRDSGADPRATHQYKIDFQNVPRDPEPSSPQEREEMIAATWRWSSEDDGGVCQEYDSLTGAFEARWNFRPHLVELLCTVETMEADDPSFYSHHQALGREMARFLGAKKILYLPEAVCANFGMPERLHGPYEDTASWIAANAGPRWDSLDQIRRDTYEFRGFFLESL